MVVRGEHQASACVDNSANLSELSELIRVESTQNHNAASHAAFKCV
jgi:hypothetical protein